MEAGQLSEIPVIQAAPKRRPFLADPIRIILLIGVNLLIGSYLFVSYYGKNFYAYRIAATDLLAISWQEVYPRIINDPDLDLWAKERLRLVALGNFKTGDPIPRAYQANDLKTLFLAGDASTTRSLNHLLARFDTVRLDALDQADYDLLPLRDKLIRLKNLRLELLRNSRLKLSRLDASRLARILKNRSQTGAMPAGDAAVRSILLQTRPGEQEYFSAIDDQLHKLQADRKEIIELAQQIDLDLVLLYRKLAVDLGYPHLELFDQNLLLAGRDPAAAIKQIEPNIGYYAKLREGLAHYLQLAQAGEFLQLKYTGRLELEASGPEVAALQRRLNQEGFYKDSPSGLFDQTTTDSVKDFQERHGLLADGVVGERTVNMLNRSVFSKVDQIKQALKSFQTANWRAQNYFIRINVPAFELEIVTEGEIAQTHRVIVGNRRKIKLDPKDKKEEPKRHNATPLFSDEIQTVIYNPRWYVPERIKDEIDRENLSKDPIYLERHNYVTIIEENGEERYYQEGGNDNALGRVKILFPNRYAVYMHDTPGRSLFNRTHRDFSHGCIRVHEALDLAKFLLEKDQNSASKKVREMLANPKKAYYLGLRKQVPVHIEYQLVSVNRDGKLIFHEDLYKIFEPDLDPPKKG